MVDIKTFQIESTLVPSPIKYNVLFPSSYETINEKYPLLLFLEDCRCSRPTKKK